MRDQARSNQLSDHRGQVRGDCLHTVFEVFVELRAVVGQLEHLVCEAQDVLLVFFGDFCAERNLCSLFNVRL